MPAVKIDHDEILEVIDTPGYNVRFYFHSPVEGPCQVEGWQEWAMRMQVGEEGATE